MDVRQVVEPKGAAAGVVGAWRAIEGLERDVGREAATESREGRQSASGERSGGAETSGEEGREHEGQGTSARRRESRRTSSNAVEPRRPSSCFGDVDARRARDCDPALTRDVTCASPRPSARARLCVSVCCPDRPGCMALIACLAWD